MDEQLPVPRPRDANQPSKPHRVTGKLKIALDALVHEALEMDACATRAGLSTRAVRMAMQKPWVMAYMREQRAMLVHELTASNPHHLRTMRARSPNQMVRLGAVRAIEDIGAGRHGGQSVSVNVGVVVQAGYVLDLTERKDEER